MSGWLNQKQQQVINYLVEENRVLREQIGNRGLRFNDDQRRRLAPKVKKFGPRILDGSRHYSDSRDFVGLASTIDR
jgi:hypothetical protein